MYRFQILFDIKWNLRIIKDLGNCKYGNEIEQIHLLNKYFIISNKIFNF
jgi:hypothetical protein